MATIDLNTFFVATNGKDTWSGRLASPNSAGTDGPLATLAAAQKKMAAGSNKKTYVRGGTYNVATTISLGSADAGVTFEGYPGETPIIRGGRSIGGWTQDSTGLWSTAVSSSTLPGGTLNALFVGNAPMTRARYPNYDPTQPVKGGWRFADTPSSSTNKSTQFRFRSGDLPTNTVAANLKVHIFDYSGWNAVDAAVQSVDFGTRTVTFKSAPGGTFNTGCRYFVYDTTRQLDTAGEWAYDPAAGRISLRAPTTGFDKAQIFGGTSAAVFSIYGTHNITIKNMVLGDTTSAGRGITINNSTAITLSGTVIRNVDEAVRVMGSSSNINVFGNQLSSVGSYGVRVDQSAGRMVINSNWFRDVGGRMGSGSAVWMMGSSNNSVSHNRFERIAKFAIAGGSTLGTTASYNNVVEYNQIVQANMQPSDGGAIMFSGVKGELSNSVIRYNDITGTSAAGTTIAYNNKVNTAFFDVSMLESYAVYLDDYASGYTIEGNVAHNNVNGVIVHGGRNNTIRSNIFANNQGDAFVAGEKVWLNLALPAARNNAFVSNIVYMGATANRAINLEGSRLMISATKNLYGGAAGTSSQAFHAWPKLMSTGIAGSLTNWKAAGLDSGALQADPKFTNIAAGDFTLQSGSPAPSLGYTAIPVSQIGILSTARTSATFAAAY